MPLENPATARAFSALAKAEAAKQALDFLGDDLGGKQHALDLQIFSKLERGEVVDPQLALQVFLQKWAVWQFMHKLLGTLKTGEGAARVLTPVLEGEH